MNFNQFASVKAKRILRQSQSQNDGCLIKKCLAPLAKVNVEQAKAPEIPKKMLKPNLKSS